MSAKGGKAPTTKMKEVKSMAKKIGIIVLLCFSLCVGGVSAFANEGHDETDTQTLIETQPPVSSVLFRQDGADIQQSTDEGKTWQSYSPIEETDYFTYDEFSAWIENETENIQKLVDAGEWTEAEATEALEYYDEILKSILEGKMVGKRASSSDDQLFFSMPDNAQPEQYQTFVFDGNTYKSIGPFDTEEELFNAIKEYTGYDIEKMSEEELYEACVKMEIPVDKTMGKGKLIDEIFGEKCEGHYIQPTFIYDYPKEMSPLTKKHRENPELTERFELFVNGKEVANAYSELNDPIDQLERFQDQLKLQERGDDEAMYIDYDFVRALEYGMPPTSGMGIGIDRLCMFLTNSASIQDVLFFPQMKPEKKVTVDGDEKYEALGIPKEWIAVVKKAGYQTVEALKAVGNTNKLHQELCGINKKEKLGLSGLTPEEVKKWLA